MLLRYGPDARLLAGGTDLLVDLKAGRVSTKHLISLRRIDSLRGISTTDDALCIGALTTVTELSRSAMVRDHASPILDATARMAAPPIRNVATIGGNIVSAVPCADLPPILIVLGASAVIWSPNGEREVPLENMFVGPRQTLLGEGEVLRQIRVPTMKPGFGAAYERFGLREGNAIAVAAVAAGLQLDDGGVIRSARVVLGAVAPLPMIVEDVESLLSGRAADDAAFAEAAHVAKAAAQPISDIRASADFRRDLIEVLTRRALQTARRRARNE